MLDAQKSQHRQTARAHKVNPNTHLEDFLSDRAEYGFHCGLIR
jgi:hypothetical protein